MSESFEQPKVIYPTVNEITELRRIADTKATGVNVHKVKNIIHFMRARIELAEIRGWDQEQLDKFNESKRKLFEILSDTK